MPYLQATSLLLSMGNLGLNLLNYLARTQADVSPSTGLQQPYIPPFTGGQSSGILYKIGVSITFDGRTTFYPDWGYLRGKLEVRYNSVIGGALRYEYMYSFHDGSFLSTIGNPDKPSTWTVTRADGLPDTGGNLPNPNPSISNPDIGYQDNLPVSAPDVVVIDKSGEGDIIPALVPALVPATVSGLLALLAAATTLAELAIALKALIEKIFDLLKLIFDLLSQLQKLLPRGKSTVYKELGAISKDGFLRLYPSDRSKHQAISLDIRFTSLPLWKKDAILSLRSPTYYHNLGRILFVSDTMGIIKEVELNYSINSIPIPENAMGFYYHLGLDGVSKANTTCYYLRAN